MNLILTLSYLLFIFLFFCRKNNTLKNLVITTSLLKKERNISEILQWIPTTSPTLEEEIGEKRKAQPIAKKSCCTSQTVSHSIHETSTPIQNTTYPAKAQVSSTYLNGLTFFIFG